MLDTDEQPDNNSKDVPPSPGWSSARTSAIVSACILAVASAALLWAGAYPSTAARAPQVIAVVTLCGGVVVGAKAVAQLIAAVRKSGVSAKDVLNFSDSFNIGFIVAVATAAYIFMFNFFGFLAATIIFAMVAAYALGYRKHLVKLTVFSVVTSVGLYVIFTQLFMIRLPN